jgi:AGCS family alanine or glycine:cation symporter
MTDFLNWLNGEIIWGPPLIALIIITGVYVTVRSGFFQVRHLGYIFKRTLGCILRKDHVQDENDKGLLSPMRPSPPRLAVPWALATLQVWPPP